MPTIEQARQWYPSSDPVHGFDHILRVYRLAGHIAQEEGADLELVQAAALLHDASGAQPQPGEDDRSGHQHASASFARQVLLQEGWSEERIAAVENCIRSHRFRDNRELPSTLEAKVLFDADKLDAIGAIGVARSIGYAVQAGQPVFAEASQQFIATGEKLPGEPHSSYHEYLFKLRHLQDLMFTPTGKRLAADRHRFMTAFYDRLSQEIQGLL